MTMFKAGVLPRLFALLMVFTLCFGVLSPVASVYAGPESVYDDYVLVTKGEDGKPDSITISSSENGKALQLGDVVNKYKGVAVVITSILTITMFIFMLIQFMKLGASGDNDSARRKAIVGILTTGIATALFGGASIIIGFFWNFLAGV